MKRFVLTSPAAGDLREIKDYLVARAGTAMARRVFREVRAAMDLIGTRPDIGHARHDLTDKPLKFWPVYSYLIVYDPTARPVVITRVLHASRDVETILG